MGATDDTEEMTEAEEAGGIEEAIPSVDDRLEVEETADEKTAT